MLPPAIVEQQAKLGVSAEASKAERLKRQQARFRDRGGAFVPSDSNPLVDILLARTVSGESPSKRGTRDVPAKRASFSKESRDGAGSSRAKLPASGKGSAKAVAPEARTKPPPKRRGTTSGKKKIQDVDSEPEQPLLANTKSKSTSKGKGKKPATSSTSNAKPQPQPKAKAKAKPKSTKQVIKVLASDDDETLVEVPRRVKSNPRESVRENAGESDDDVPIVRKQAVTRPDDSKASGAKTIKRIKAERAVGAKSSEKKTFQDVEETMDEERPKATAKMRPVTHDEQEVVEAPPARKRRAAGTISKSAKPKLHVKTKPEPEPRPAGGAGDSEKPRAMAKGKEKVRAEPAQDILEPEEGRDDDERPLERVSKLKKRKKEEDNYDDRPRKVVKFSETPLLQSSSNKLKENQFDKPRASKSNVKDEPDGLTKPLSRTKTPKGPPLEVLERIKANAARHLRCVDSEPDELDFLS